MKYELPKDRPEQVETLLGLALGHRTPSGPCPNPEDLAALSEGGLNPVRRREVLDHVAYCEHCYPLWLGIVEMTGTEHSPLTLADTPRQAGLWARLRRWAVAPKSALLGGSLVSVLAAALLLLIWKPWLVEFSQGLEQSYQTLAQLRQEASLPESFPWERKSEMRSKGFDLWEGNSWDRKDLARRTFAAGVRAGLQQATPMTPFWQALITGLPANRPACLPGDEACQRLEKALFNTGRWATLIAIACQVNPSALPDSRGQVPLPLWESFWEEQSAALLQLTAELGELPQARVFHEFMVSWTQQAAETPRSRLCSRIGKLLELGLDGK